MYKPNGHVAQTPDKRHVIGLLLCIQQTWADVHGQGYVFMVYALLRDRSSPQRQQQWVS